MIDAVMAIKSGQLARRQVVVRGGLSRSSAYKCYLPFQKWAGKNYN